MNSFHKCHSFFGEKKKIIHAENLHWVQLSHLCYFKWYVIKPHSYTHLWIFMSYGVCSLELSHSHTRIWADIRLIYFTSSCRDISLTDHLKQKRVSWQIKLELGMEIPLKLQTEEDSHGWKVTQPRKRRWWTSTTHENGAILQESHSTAISLYRHVLCKPGSTQCEACTAIFFHSSFPKQCSNRWHFRFLISIPCVSVKKPKQLVDV